MGKMNKKRVLKWGFFIVSIIFIAISTAYSTQITVSADYDPATGGHVDGDTGGGSTGTGTQRPGTTTSGSGATAGGTTATATDTDIGTGTTAANAGEVAANPSTPKPFKNGDGLQKADNSAEVSSNQNQTNSSSNSSVDETSNSQSRQNNNISNTNSSTGIKNSTNPNTPDTAKEVSRNAGNSKASLTGRKIKPKTQSKGASEVTSIVNIPIPSAGGEHHWKYWYKQTGKTYSKTEKDGDIYALTEFEKYFGFSSKKKYTKVKLDFAGKTIKRKNSFVKKVKKLEKTKILYYTAYHYTDTDHNTRYLNTKIKYYVNRNHTGYIGYNGVVETRSWSS